MNRLLLLTLLSAAANAVSAADTQSLPSTYILQVSSNLECQSLEIELLPKDGAHPHVISFETGAFGAASLPPAEYNFGAVTCHEGARGTETFEMLKGTLRPVSVKAGQAYFGGKLIIKEIEQAASTTPDLIDNCVRGTGRFRKESSNECRDGVGVSGKAAVEKIVNFYMPPLKKDEIDEIRDALNASEDQLVYMPITAKPL